MASSGSVGTLSWSAKLDSNEFKKGVKKVKRQMKDAQKNVTESLKVITSGFAIATGAVVGMTGALGALVKESAESVRELENLARISDTTFNDFVRMAEGAKKFGVEQDKLSDILKDVKDRVGDFLATGGGPMKDFFEQIAPKVGVTAEAFRNLSGKDSLQLFFTSLEKANLSQAEMVFYLEAMASDLTALQPLLKDDGKLFQELGDKAEKAGLLLPVDKVEDLKESMMGFDDLSTNITGALRQVSAELAPTFTAITDDINKIISDSDVELEILFESIGIYFEQAMDGIRFLLENAGIVSGMETWQDVFLETSFFLQNSFEIALLNVLRFTEKILSLMSKPFRDLFSDIFTNLSVFTTKAQELLAKLNVDTSGLENLNEVLNDSIVALDADNIFGSFDGVLSGEIEDQLKESEKAFKATVATLRAERAKVEDPASKDSATEDGGGGLFGGLFKGIDKAFTAIEDGVKFMSEPNKHFDKGIEEFNKSGEPIEFEQKSGTLATAGSVEEFNLLRDQRNQELAESKKQTKLLAQIAKTPVKAANLS